MPTRVAIIGRGNVGSALEKGLERGEQEVQTVGKEPDRVAELAEWGEIIVLAVPFPERENALEEMGEAIEGKTIVDVSNAVTPENEFASSSEQSGAEELQAMAPEARVVKAFNTVFAEQMASGNLHGDPLTVFAAGDDEQARQHAISLAEAIGFETVDAGPLKNARWLEALGYFNMQLAFDQEMGLDIGFRLLNPRSA